MRGARREVGKGVTETAHAYGSPTHAAGQSDDAQQTLDEVFDIECRSERGADRREEGETIASAVPLLERALELTLGPIEGECHGAMLLSQSFGRGRRVPGDSGYTLPPEGDEEERQGQSTHAKV
jgi:hypothetical protein